MRFKITYKPDLSGKITLCCPNRFWESECIELVKVKEEESCSNSFICKGCGSVLISYGVWIISELSQEEIELSEDFIKRHKHNKESEIEYIISNSNGIGCNIYIKCLTCEDMLNITDYGKW